MSEVYTSYGREFESKMIQSCEYTPDTKVLIVTFNNGQKYSYSDVDEETVNGFMEPESAGRYFLANIKGKFDYSKLEDNAE